MYLSIIDLRERLSETKLIQLTDFAGTGEIDSGRIDAAIAAASGIVDSYCAARYSLPLAISEQIKDTALSICIYKLHSLRQLSPDKVRLDYEDAIAFLKDVAAGKATLDQSGTVQAVPSVGVKVRDHDADPEAFDDVRLEDYIG